MADDRSVADMWSAFVAARPGLAGPESTYSAWHFCDNQKDADGFIKLNALRLRLGAMKKRS